MILVAYVILWGIIWWKEGWKRALLRFVQFLGLCLIFYYSSCLLQFDCTGFNIAATFFSFGYLIWLYAYCMREGYVPWFWGK